MEVTSLFQYIALGVIYVSLLFTVIYILIVGYHWFQYGSSRATSMTAMLLFLAGAGTFILGMFTSYFFLF